MYILYLTYLAYILMYITSRVIHKNMSSVSVSFPVGAYSDYQPLIKWVPSYHGVARSRAADG
jgi:hypothetical protein